MAERSLLAAVSGIDANQTLLDEIGDNIANADTVGYKAGQVEFGDLLSEQIAGATAPGATSGGTNPVAVGSGVLVTSVGTDLTEGSLESTGNPNDVAIQGSGYLVVDKGGQQLYTRDGALTPDAAGNLTVDGGVVMGWAANAAGTINTNAPLTAIQIPTGQTIGSTATTELTLGGNLPAWDGVGTPPSITVTTYGYDSLGAVVPVTFTFTGVAGTANQWTIQGTVPNPGGGTDDLFTATTLPKMTFNPTTGQITAITGATVGANGTLSLKVNTMPAGYTFPTGDTWSVDFPAPGSTGSVTQYDSQQTLGVRGQDGYPAGALESYSISSDGVITGSFSNGQTRAIAQLAMASFANPGGLVDQGGGLFATTPNSGQAQVGVAGTGVLGTLLGGQLEQSNVDMGTELTDLITAQEAYEANTKVVTTTEQAVQALETMS
jgi:flagellar hook protein FlgE